MTVADSSKSQALLKLETKGQEYLFIQDYSLSTPGSKFRGRGECLKNIAEMRALVPENSFQQSVPALVWWRLTSEPVNVIVMKLKECEGKEKGG